MFEFFRGIVVFAVPLFVVSTMLNVGLTQRPADILGYLRNWPFVLKMVIANFVLAPLLMIVILQSTSFAPALQAGLLVFSLGAGAPFLIKLTERAEHDVALGAATLLVLLVITVGYMPLVLPRFLEGMPVDAGAIGRTLMQQMLLPIAVGMLVVQFWRGLARRIQPWVGRLGNIALYVVIGATFIGYLPDLRNILGTGVLLAGLVFIAGAFVIGYLSGHGIDHLEDVSGLGTAQRNTAAAMTVASQNFTDPTVLVVITLVSTAGIVMLLAIARVLRRDNLAATPAPAAGPAGGPR